MREALRVLIYHAAANVAGTGRGVRPEITSDQRTEVATAIRRVYRQAEGHEADAGALRNLGLYGSNTEESAPCTPPTP